MGERITRYLSDGQITKSTGIAVFDRKIVSEYPLHWHNYLELELILEGSGIQVLNGERQLLHRGCFSVMRLTDYHQVQPIENLRLFSLLIDDKLLTEEVLGQLMTPRSMFYRLSEDETSVIRSLFQLCMEENNASAPDRIYLKYLILCVFLRILRQVPVPNSGIGNTDDGIQKVLLYLRMHFRENPGLQEAAEIAHYNPCHFSTTFHRQVGLTYTAYLNLLKLSYAKELLLSTDLKIADICLECGFESQTNFLRIFKAQTGMTPTQFRSK